MNWTRGKKGKRRALSMMTGATYVYVEGKLRVARAKGEWEDLGMFPDIGAAKEVAQCHDEKLLFASAKEALEQAAGKVAAVERAHLRDLYKQVVTSGPWESVYREFCTLRKRGITRQELQNHMVSLSTEDRYLLSMALEDFYNAGMRVV